MRLIDADKLMEHVYRDRLDSRELIANMIKKAPTVKEIPMNIPIDLIFKALEQDSKTDYKSFCEWVAGEIFTESWEYNKDSFAEIACRKLEKLGIVAREDDIWKLRESEGKNETCN